MTVLTQAAIRADFEWEFGDPVSLAFIVEDFDMSGTYECVIRAEERYGKILAQPVVTATYVPNVGTQFLVTLTDSTEVPIGYWWYAITQVAGVTRFAGRINVGDNGLRTIAYASILDTSFAVTTEVEDVAS